MRGLLRHLPPVLHGVRVIQHLSQGHYVATRAELETIHGVAPVFDWRPMLGAGRQGVNARE